MPRSLNVAVIGAGVAGLATALELKREGHKVVVYEKSNQIGGTWVYNHQVESDLLGLDPNRERVHSSLYYSLQTNLPRHLMGFSDYPFTIRKNGELRDFPGHQEVLQFLKNFARDFGLVDLIRFDTEVVRVEKEYDLWVLESTSTKDESSTSELLFVMVIIASQKLQIFQESKHGLENKFIATIIEFLNHFKISLVKNTGCSSDWCWT